MELRDELFIITQLWNKQLSPDSGFYRVHYAWNEQILTQGVGEEAVPTGCPPHNSRLFVQAAHIHLYCLWPLVATAVMYKELQSPCKMKVGVDGSWQWRSVAGTRMAFWESLAHYLFCSVCFATITLFEAYWDPQPMHPILPESGIFCALWRLFWSPGVSQQSGPGSISNRRSGVHWKWTRMRLPGDHTRSLWRLSNVMGWMCHITF